MTTVGIIGGIGPESTIDYYRRIMDGWRDAGLVPAPSIIINSIDVRRALALVATDHGALIEYLLPELQRLAGAGADFGIISANTPHIVFDQLAARTPIPLVSIVEVTAEELVRRGVSRAVLLGTRFTMEASFYPDVLAGHGVDVVAPDADDRAWVHAAYIDELLVGQFLETTRTRFRALLGRMRLESGIDGVILGGTELPLLLTETHIDGMPLIDTTAVHVAAIIERLRPK